MTTFGDTRIEGDLFVVVYTFDLDRSVDIDSGLLQLSLFLKLGKSASLL